MSLAWTGTLAQIPGLGNGAAVPMLPDPPMVEHLLLESPATPAAAFGIAGAAVFLMLNRAGRARQGAAAAGALVVLAAGLIALGASVTTARETLIDRTGRLIGAVSRGSASGAGQFLAEDVRATALRSFEAPDKQAILNHVETDLGPGGRFAVKNAAVLASAAVVDGANAARTQVRMRVTVEALGAPSLSWWRLNWRKDPDGQWRVIAIDVLEMDGMRGPMLDGLQ